MFFSNFMLICQLKWRILAKLDDIHSLSSLFQIKYSVSNRVALIFPFKVVQPFATLHFYKASWPMDSERGECVIPSTVKRHNPTPVAIAPKYNQSQARVELHLPFFEWLLVSFLLARSNKFLKQEWNKNDVVA